MPETAARYWRGILKYIGNTFVDSNGREKLRKNQTYSVRVGPSRKVIQVYLDRGRTWLTTIPYQSVEWDAAA